MKKIAFVFFFACARAKKRKIINDAKYKIGRYSLTQSAFFFFFLKIRIKIFVILQSVIFVGNVKCIY